MNDMRKRLKDLLLKMDVYDECECKICGEEICCDECFAEKAADYLLANGVISLPCKVGDSCYPLWHSRNKPVVERKISRITYSARNVIIGYYENDGQYRPPLRTRVLGTDVFLTREEAERALKERKQNGC